MLLVACPHHVFLTRCDDIWTNINLVRTVRKIGFHFWHFCANILSGRTCVIQCGSYFMVWVALHISLHTSRKLKLLWLTSHKHDLAFVARLHWHTLFLHTWFAPPSIVWLTPFSSVVKKVGTTCILTYPWQAQGSSTWFGIYCIFDGSTVAINKNANVIMKKLEANLLWDLVT